MSDDEKFEWAKQQRQHGNRFFQTGDYKQAMDVYLTCLVAMNPACFNQMTENKIKSSEEGCSTNDESITPNPSTSVVVDKSQRELLLPVLLNLSLCTLKLGMFKKTERFCNFAIEASCGKENAKVYFRRGKARMLMGSYKDANDDLQNSLRLVTEEMKMIDQQSPSSSSRKVNLSKEKESIIKEINKLKSLRKEAELNLKRQKKAMRRILGGEKIARVESNDKKINGHTTTNDNETPFDNTRNRIPKQNDDGTASLYKNTQNRRPYSTLTAPDRREQIIFDTWFRNKDPLHQKNNTIAVSFIRSFLSVFENCLRSTLYFLGDEDAMTRSFDDELDERNEQRKLKTI